MYWDSFFIFIIPFRKRITYPMSNRNNSNQELVLLLSNYGPYFQFNL